MRSVWQQRFAFPDRQSWVWPTLALLSGLAIALLPLPLAAGIVAGAAVLLGILIEPLVGLALTLLLAPFGALESVLLGGSSFDSGQLLLVLTTGSWVAHSIARRRIPITLPSGKMPAARLTLLAFGLFCFIGGLSLLDAPSLLDGVKELLKWAQIALVAIMVADLGRRPERFPWVTAAVLGGVVAQGLIGIWQFGLRGHGPEHFLILDRFYRAYGTFEQPNPFAGYLGLTLPVALGWAMGQFPGKQRTTLHWLRWLAALAVPGILALALLMSWSRGGWLGAAAGLTAMFFFLPRKRWVGTALVVALALGGILSLQSGLLPASIAARLTDFTEYVSFEDVRGVDVTVQNYAVLERMAHWQAALSMADHSPWLGVGFGNYAAAYADSALINWPYALGHAHNYYLNLLAEIGILGLLAYLAFWGAVIWLTIQVANRLRGPHRWLALGLIGAWVHLSVHHVVDKLYVNNIYLQLGALLGVLILLQRKAMLPPLETEPDGNN